MQSCASGARSVEPGARLTFERFSIQTPEGRGWSVEDKEPVVTFRRIGGHPEGPPEVTTLFIERNFCGVREPWRSHAELADVWLSGDLRHMEELAGRRGERTIGDIRKAEALVGGKRLYTLRYRKSGGESRSGESWVVTGAVCVWVPPDFDRTLEIYCFRIEEWRSTNGPSSPPDLSRIDPVIASVALH